MARVEPLANCDVVEEASMQLPSKARPENLGSPSKYEHDNNAIEATHNSGSLGPPPVRIGSFQEARAELLHLLPGLDRLGSSEEKETRLFQILGKWIPYRDSRADDGLYLGSDQAWTQFGIPLIWKASKTVKENQSIALNFSEYDHQRTSAIHAAKL
ncbi:hypothetical protein HD806DRAFT_537900 [Xylariaceae sp. AK1471]|nr:hypothetical protein HD806DRAFT_537900 [Xylariaceae sp. AK1471]